MFVCLYMQVMVMKHVYSWIKIINGAGSSKSGTNNTMSCDVTGIQKYLFKSHTDQLFGVLAPTKAVTLLKVLATSLSLADVCIVEVISDFDKL